MNSELKSARSIFLAAVEELSGEERTRYIDSACGGDESLRREVLRLVNAYGDLNSFMEHPAAGAAPTVNLEPAEQVGAIIGRYKLLEQIGEGGMGVVYVAEQSEPVRRRVALKIIKPGMDTRQVIARFEAERQALALMDHPNIAKIFDAGTTGEGVRFQVSGVSEDQADLSPTPDTRHPTPNLGRPYFVMELVRGMPITEYCDQSQQNVRNRLNLFMTVCHAVQHAHQKGVIHRDIKPSNVLVTMHDGQPVVKIIDFGIAKAINQQLTERTIYTAFTELIGTPLYMSPEQAELSGLDVDTRSDVYSLGVLLYELLTGHTPFDRDSLVKSGLDEVRRMIREDEPPRPSQRISTLKADAASTISQRRGIDQRQLTRELRGELDWIVMKALEKDRNRRYESASEFSADIEHLLKDEPVAAGPPSALYRFRKFARRRRGVLVSLALIVAALVAGTAISLWQAAVAKIERKSAVGRLYIGLGILDLIREEIAGNLAKIPRASPLQRRILEESLNYYDQLLASDPDNSTVQFARAVTARSLSKVYLSTLDDSLHAKGFDLLKQAIAVQESQCTAEPDDLPKLRQLGMSYEDYAHWLEIRPTGDGQSLLELRNKYAEICRKLAEREPANEQAQVDHIEALTVLSSHSLDHYERHPEEKDPARALALSRQAVQLAERLADGNLPKKDRLLVVAQCYMCVGHAEEASNKAPDAELAYRKALEIRELLLKDEPADVFLRLAVADANDFLARLLRMQDRLDEEEPYFQRAVQLIEGVLEEYPDSPQQLQVAVLHSERIAYFEQKWMWHKASEMYPACLLHLRQLWKEHPHFATGIDYRDTCFDYANLLFELGQTDASREAYRETLRIANQLLKPIPADNAVSFTSAPVSVSQRQFTPEEQNRIIKSGLSIIESTCPFPELLDRPTHVANRDEDLRPRSLFELASWLTRAEFRLRTGDYRGALADFTFFNRTAPELDSERGADTYHIVREAMCHDLLGESDEATQDYDKAASPDSKNPWPRAMCMKQLFWLAKDLWKMGRQDEARHCWAAAVERTRMSFETIPSESVRFNLGVAHFQLGNYAESVKLLEASAEFLDNSDPVQNDGNWGHFYFVAMAHASLGHDVEARKWFERGRQWDEKHAAALHPKDREPNEATRKEAAKLLAIPDETGGV
jgi:serine/threonine protein kinase